MCMMRVYLSMMSEEKNISDIKNNPRLTLPKPLSGHEEAIISCLKSDFMEIFKSYLADNCDENGKIKAANLTKSQLRGLRSLLRRIANREIMVVPTDKSGKLAAINWDVYCASMNCQIGADCLVGWSEVGPTQDNMNGHVSAWLKFTNTGQNWDQSQRIREGMISHGQCVPPLYGLLKDHKPVGAWDPELGAPYRPVCGACLGPNASLSDLLSEIIDCVADELEGSSEIRATEELSFHIEQCNLKLIALGAKPITIGSLDVVSMFPNLKASEVSKMVFEAVKISKINFMGFDYQQIGIYLALNLSKNEIKELGLSKFVPTRLVKKGGKSKIKMSSQETRSPNIYLQKWSFTPFTPNLKEKRLMFSKAMEIAVKVCFRNHLYQFKGLVYRQTEGGPIGLRLSMAVSRIVMGMWDKQLSKLGEASGWVIHLLKRYVDDVSAILETLKMGVRWVMPNVSNVSDVSNKCENVSGVIEHVVLGGPPGKPATVGPQGKQPNCANVSSKC